MRKKKNPPFLVYGIVLKTITRRGFSCLKKKICNWVSTQHHTIKFRNITQLKIIRNAVDLSFVSKLLEDSFITAVNVSDGAYVDGTKFNELLDWTSRSGINIEEVCGDKAHFRKPVLDKIKEMGIEAYIPISEMVYRIDENRFSYNKDSDEWFCSQGNSTVRKWHKKDKKNNRESYRYYFEKETCRNCPQRGVRNLKQNTRKELAKSGKMMRWKVFMDWTAPEGTV